MTFKNTKIWKYLRHIKYSIRANRRAKKALNMPLSEYESFISKVYNEKMRDLSFADGEKMDFESPKTFTQKQQWLNLYDNDKRKTIYTDKYEVRNYIKKTIGEEYLVPLISIDGREVFTNVDQINFDKLPNSFVIKCTHGSHMNVIISDKSALSKQNIKKIKKQLSEWLNIDYTFAVGLELQYHGIKPRIIIEKYIASGEDLPDYKFFCFSGQPKFMWVDTNRFKGHRRTCYSLEFEKEPFSFDFLDDVEDVLPPVNFDKMKKLATLLSSGFIFVRVDFYEVSGCLFFGELTFSSHAGLMPPRPIEYNKILGDLIIIDNSKRVNNYKFRRHEDN